MSFRLPRANQTAESILMRLYFRQETGGLTVDSIALCYQIRTLDKRRLTEMFGVIADQDLRQSILDALRFQLGV